MFLRHIRNSIHSTHARFFREENNCLIDEERFGTRHEMENAWLLSASIRVDGKIINQLVGIFSVNSHNAFFYTYIFEGNIYSNLFIERLRECAVIIATGSVETYRGLIKFSVSGYLMSSSVTEEAYSHTSSWEIANYYQWCTLQRI